MSIQYIAIALNRAPGYNRHNTKLEHIKSIK